MAEHNQITEIKQHSEEADHPTPLTYVKIAAILAIITAIEVAIFYVEALQGVIKPIFIILSGGKFALVAMFYMHLKFDNRLFSMLFVGGLILAMIVSSALMVLFKNFL